MPELSNQIQDPLPLKAAPFYSRVNNNILRSPVKNYYMIAFNPGYALQASELNELQEIFFINQTLSALIQTNYIPSFGYVPYYSVTTIGGDSTHKGCIPLNVDQIEFSRLQSSINQNGKNIAVLDIIVYPGWYHWTDPDSGLLFWVYNDTTFAKTLTTTTATDTTPEYIGFTVSKEEISCCSTGDENECSELRDNSQGTTSTYNTCGASRLKLNITDVTLGDVEQSSTFSAFMKVTTSTPPDNPVIYLLYGNYQLQ
jgi:hypothetical protein